MHRFIVSLLLTTTAAYAYTEPADQCPRIVAHIVEIEAAQRANDIPRLRAAYLAVYAEHSPPADFLRRVTQSFDTERRLAVLTLLDSMNKSRCSIDF